MGSRSCSLLYGVGRCTSAVLCLGLLWEQGLDQISFLKGAQETFEHYYRKQRRKQARLVLQPSSNMVGALGVLCIRNGVDGGGAFWIVGSPAEWLFSLGGISNLVLFFPLPPFPARNVGWLSEVLQSDRGVGASCVLVCLLPCYGFCLVYAMLP